MRLLEVPETILALIYRMVHTLKFDFRLIPKKLGKPELEVL